MVHALELVAVDVGFAGEVGAARERVAGAGEHEHAVGRALADLRERLEELVPHRRVDRVLLVGAVERDGDDTVRAAIDDQGFQGIAPQKKSGTLPWDTWTQMRESVPGKRPRLQAS